MKSPPYTVRPFDDDELQSGAERQRRIKFNQSHACARIVIEHVFGLLKGRFPALKLLPGRDIPRMYKVIQALMVLLVSLTQTVHQHCLYFTSNADSLSS
jgi:hypothetical protein